MSPPLGFDQLVYRPLLKVILLLVSEPDPAGHGAAWSKHEFPAQAGQPTSLVDHRGLTHATCGHNVVEMTNLSELCRRRGPVTQDRSDLFALRRLWGSGTRGAMGLGRRRKVTAKDDCHASGAAWVAARPRAIASNLTGHLPGSLEHGQSGPRHSLISSLVHLRTPASIGVYDWPLSSQRELRGRSCTVIRNPEMRKVGGSTPPLTTSFHQCGQLVGGRAAWAGVVVGL